MTLVDQLLSADAKKAEDLNTSVFLSEKLAHIIGSKTPVEVKIKEVKSRRVNDIVSSQVDKKGNFDYSKSYDAKLRMVAEGCVEPDLRNKGLQDHFGCSLATELAEKLFGSEINPLSDAISTLSGVTIDKDEDTEKEIKN